MNDIKISICMPTRNRAGFIGQALESVISQADENVEIVIIDGASTDNTAEVVRDYIKKFKNITYRCEEKNGGVDRDMGKAIEAARGEYCWLLSDDDRLKPGAMKRMLEEIKTGYEIYLCNVTACTLQMQTLRDRYWLSREITDKVFNLHNASEMIEYCNKANSIGALFSFWSSTVLRREEWAREGYNYVFDGSAYAMASSLLSFLKRKCRLKYIQAALIYWRNDNESFQNLDGPVKRFLLDFDGYLRLADTFLADNNSVRDAFLKVMTREHPWYTIVNVTSFINNYETWRPFRAKMLKFGYNSKTVDICFALGRFKKLVSLGVMLKRKIVKSRLINRFVGSLGR